MHTSAHLEELWAKTRGSLTIWSNSVAGSFSSRRLPRSWTVQAQWIDPNWEAKTLHNLHKMHKEMH